MRWIVGVSGLAVLSFLWAQDWSKRQATLVKLGKNISITQAEFEYAYAKANGGWDVAKTHTPEQWRDYLKAYINFRRKVAQAQEEKLDTTRSFREEYQAYIRQLAKPFLLEREVLDTLMRKMYERMREEVRASHILVKGQDSAAYARALALRDSVVKGGRSFAEIARLYSDDPAAPETGGDLGYFSAFDMVAPFEDAAYQTPVGQVSMPVLTRFGYHLVYVRERGPNPGARKTAHILVRWGPTYAAKDSTEAYKRIQEIYERLQKGESFEELAKNYSDDPFSAARGGELGWMRLHPDMEVVKRRLGAGEVSMPFKTRFGWHILKVLEVKPIRSFEEMRSEIKARLQRDERYKAAEKQYFDQRLKAYNYEENPATRETLFKALDTLYPDLEGALSKLPPSLLKATLFTLGKQKYTVQDFLSYWAQNRALLLERRLSREGFQEALRSYAREKVLDLEIPNLRKRYPEYSLLEREYYYGMLFFLVSEREVWRKSVEDTAGLRAFYEERKTEYPAGPRLEVIEVQGSDSLNLADLAQRVAEPSLSAIDSANKFGRYNWRILPQYIESSQAPAPLQRLFQEGNGAFPQWVGPVGSGREWRLYAVLRKLPAGYKTFEEVKVELIQRYQQKLEEDWLAKLEKRYPAQVNEKVFSRLFR
jgi:peptidyl-prolyl cis-trans isomerase SurA